MVQAAKSQGLQFLLPTDIFEFPDLLLQRWVLLSLVLYVVLSPSLILRHVLASSSPADASKK